jgi:Ca2+/Na+ antiporter
MGTVKRGEHLSPSVGTALSIANITVLKSVLLLFIYIYIYYIIFIFQKALAESAASGPTVQQGERETRYSALLRLCDELVDGRGCSRPAAPWT